MARNFGTVETAVRKGQHARIALAGLSGSGKALAVDELVQTPNGPVPIGTIKVGDMVLCPDGTAAPVTGVFPQGVKQIYRVVTSGGGSVRATGDHLWSTQTAAERNRQLKDIPASNAAGRRINYSVPLPAQLRTTDEIAKTLRLPSPVHQAGLAYGNNHRLREIKPFEYPEQSLPMDPYVFGALIGDGCFASVGVSFTSPDREIVDRIVAAGYPAKASPSNDIQYSISGATTLLKELDQHGKKSVDKSIPNEYLYSSIEQRLELLRGLMDTDGHADPKKNGSEFSSSSEQLINQVQWLVESLGGFATLGHKPSPTYTHNGESRIGHPSWRLYITMPIDKNPFSLERKAKTWEETNLNRQKQALHRFITDVIPDGKAEAVCIAVDHPDHEFLTANHVPTHNTYSALMIAKELTDNGNVLVIDTENNSAALYAGEFGDWSFKTYNWKPPYDPRELTQGINEWSHGPNKFDAIIIDSFSAYWSDTGGLLEIVTNAGRGNQYAGWKTGTPIQNELIQAVLRADCHIITCMRAKGDTSLEKNSSGKTEVRKLGLTAIQRENTIYEMTVYGMIDLASHALSIEKTRCSALADKTYSAFGGTVEFAKTLRQWLDGAEAEETNRIMNAEIEDALEADVAEVSDDPIAQSEVDVLIKMFGHIEDQEKRKEAKEKFVAKFGAPHEIAQSRLGEATEFVKSFVEAAN